MSFGQSFQRLSDWLQNTSKAASSVSKLTLESGLLKDFVDNMGEAGGLAGSLFKLASYTIEEPGPEQRILSGIIREFLRSFDAQLQDNSNLSLSSRRWKRFKKNTLEDHLKKTFDKKFTWLSVFNHYSEAKASWSWPIIGDLADLAERWILEAGRVQGSKEQSRHLREIASRIRGNVFEALVNKMSEMLAEPAIRDAFVGLAERSGFESRKLLAQELSGLKQQRLFDETPLDSLYISPSLVFREALDGNASPITEPQLVRRAREQHPGLWIVLGMMGGGKSCLSYELTSRLASAYLEDRRLLPVFCQWPEICSEPSLNDALAQELETRYGLSITNLAEDKNIIYVIDGFDEMGSRRDEAIIRELERLLKAFRSKGSSLVLTMRRSMTSRGLQQLWSENSAKIVEIRDFSTSKVRHWLERWQRRQPNASLDESELEELLRILRKSSDLSAGIPLLLYLMTKQSESLIGRKEKRLSEVEVFGNFVRSTLKGSYGNRPRGPYFDPKVYRLVLQEIASIASWPASERLCDQRSLEKQVGNEILKRLDFKSSKTAFILHFFDPDGEAEGYRFYPDGFRQYLLAERCARLQVQRHLGDVEIAASDIWPAQRDPADQLAQIELFHEERQILNALYEEIGRQAREDPARLLVTLKDLGIVSEVAGAQVEALFSSVLERAVRPLDRPQWSSEIGLPAGQLSSEGVEALHPVVNLWDQDWLAVFGLYRGLGLRRRLFDARSTTSFARFLHAANSVRSVSREEAFNLSRLRFDAVQLQGFSLIRFNLQNTRFDGGDLAGSDFFGATLSGASFRGATCYRTGFRKAHLHKADLRDGNFRAADFHGADLRSAKLQDASLRSTNLSEADLSKANLAGADLRDANLTRAKLAGANLANTQLSHANLLDADLAGACLDGASVGQASFHEAKVSSQQLGKTRGRPVGVDTV